VSPLSDAETSPVAVCTMRALGEIETTVPRMRSGAASAAVASERPVHGRESQSQEPIHAVMCLHGESPGSFLAGAVCAPGRHPRGAVLLTIASR
jgi:hypothetical protein